MANTPITFLDNDKKTLLIRFINNYSCYITRWKNTYNKQYTHDTNFTYASLGSILVDLFNGIQNKRDNREIFNDILLELTPTLKQHKNVFFINHKIPNGNLLADEFEAYRLLMTHLKNNNSVNY
jgi:hypothetical protein